MRPRHAFTLIELLIVVAIIAILAAIAVPNFLEAQMRSKVSRTKADMRSLATAIEAYTVDANKPPSSRLCYGTGAYASGYSGASVFYPLVTTGAVSPRFIKLTTPIAYITSVFPDPFCRYGQIKNPQTNLPDNQYDDYDYISAFDFWHTARAPSEERGGGITSGAGWRLCSAGPDAIMAYGGGTSAQSIEWARKGVDYDPTNGTVSNGDIVRIGGGPFNKWANPPSIDRVQNQYNVNM